MPDLTAERRLVKSPPELWTELSEVERLAEHLGAFGEIKITKLEPEHTVAWEGEHASGTVSIEAAGWGTRVTLTALLAEGETEPEEPEQPTLESAAVEEPAAPAYSRANILARLFFAKAPAPLRSEVPGEPPVVEPEPEEPPPFEEPEDPRPAVDEPDQDEPRPDAARARAVLDEMLDTLGAAHKKPFVRE